MRTPRARGKAPRAEKKKMRKKKRALKGVDQKLKAYSLVAMAAGVRALALPQSAEAQIVYTPAHVKLSEPYSLDLNNDGTVDFNLIPWNSASIGGSLRIQWLDVCHAPAEGSHACIQSSSSVQANADNVVLASGNDAAALTAGAEIGPEQQFIGTGRAVYMGGRVWYSQSQRQRWNGPWVNGGDGVTDRYLGLKFKIDGEFHYGWARISLKTTPHHGFTAYLMGYAYETIANQGIGAGETGEADKAADGRVPSLGALAAGAEGLGRWRKGAAQ